MLADTNTVTLEYCRFFYLWTKDVLVIVYSEEEEEEEMPTLRSETILVLSLWDNDTDAVKAFSDSRPWEVSSTPAIPFLRLACMTCCS